MMELFRKSTWTFDVVITTDGSAAAPVADLELKFTARSAKAKDKVITAESGNGITVTDEDTGRVQIVLTREQTEEIPIGNVFLQLTINNGSDTEVSDIYDAVVIEPL